MVPKKIGDKKLTLKQRKWLNIYIETGNATEAARQSYDCNEESARKIGSENYAKLDVAQLMEEMGLGRVRILKKLEEKLDAKKWHSSHTEPDRLVDDNATQIKAIELGAKILRIHGADNQTNIQNNIGEMSIEFVAKT